MRCRIWLLLALAGCATPWGPERVDPVAGRAGLLTPCPASAHHRVYPRAEVVVVQCETGSGAIDGWKASFWPDGHRALFAEYRRGLPHGWVSTWDEQGRKRSESHWVDGLRAGQVVGWHPSGRIASSVRYRAGLRHGRQRLYYEDGKPLAQAEFRDGVQHGRAVAWHPNGRVQAEGAYRKGRAHGVWSYWDASGALDTRIRWHAGHQVPRGAQLGTRRRSRERTQSRQARR